MMPALHDRIEPVASDAISTLPMIGYRTRVQLQINKRLSSHHETTVLHLQTQTTPLYLQTQTTPLHQSAQFKT